LPNLVKQSLARGRSPLAAEADSSLAQNDTLALMTNLRLKS
jgi:hypothetical protein